MGGEDWVEAAGLDLEAGSGLEAAGAVETGLEVVVAGDLVAAVVAKGLGEVETD